jgi:lysophospholipid acyltransferase (LPLAT)-like uncharacterized protein
MRWHKRLLKNERVLNGISWLAAQYVGFVFKTTRWQRVGWDNAQEYWNENMPFITAFWHNRLMMGPFGWKSTMPFYMLISGHNDGKVIAKTVAEHGIYTIPGSKSKGGIGALKVILKTLKEGGCVGITPDGPRGPRLVASEGIINISRLSGCDILPFTYAVGKRKLFNSWDRFIFALPFGKGVLAWGKPIKIPRQLDEQKKQALCQQLTQAMLQLADDADHLCGHQPLR